MFWYDQKDQMNDLKNNIPASHRILLDPTTIIKSLLDTPRDIQRILTYLAAPKYVSHMVKDPYA